MAKGRKRTVKPGLHNASFFARLLIIRETCSRRVDGRRCMGLATPIRKSHLISMRASAVYEQMG